MQYLRTELVTIMLVNVKFYYRIQRFWAIAISTVKEIDIQWLKKGKVPRKKGKVIRLRHIAFPVRRRYIINAEKLNQ